MSAPVTRAEPKTVPVAETAIHGGIRLHANAPPEIRLRRGEPLEIQHRYRLTEASRDREEYRFALHAHTETEHPQPRLAREGDAWGYPDVAQGTLAQTFTFDKPGVHVVTFEAYAEYVREERLTKNVVQWDRMAETGRIRVLVE